MATKTGTGVQQIPTLVLPAGMDLSNPDAVAGLMRQLQQQNQALATRINNLSGKTFTITVADISAVNHTMVFTNGILTSST